MSGIGRIDYAPDYKSEKPDAALAQLYQAATPSELSAVAERKRLRYAVVEAAYSWRRDMTHKSDSALVRAVDELIDFESKQDQK